MLEALAALYPMCTWPPGAHTVGVLCGFGTENELLRCRADLILRTTSDLLAMLHPARDALGKTASPSPPERLDGPAGRGQATPSAATSSSTSTHGVAAIRQLLRS